MFREHCPRLSGTTVRISKNKQSDHFAITHDAIAKDLGSAREVVTRMLSRFQDDNLVKLSRGGITLMDRSGLYDLT